MSRTETLDVPCRRPASSTCPRLCIGWLPWQGVSQQTHRVSSLLVSSKLTNTTRLYLQASLREACANQTTYNRTLQVVCPFSTISHSAPSNTRSYVAADNSPESASIGKMVQTTLCLKGGHITLIYYVYQTGDKLSTSIDNANQLDKSSRLGH